MAEITVHWHEHNPWKDKVIYVTIDEMAELMATDYQTKNEHLRHFAQHGVKLDAYLIPNPLSDTPSAGVRFGERGEEYLYLHIPRERMDRIANFLLMKLLSKKTSAGEFVERMASFTLPEEECGDEDVDEFISDLDDDRLYGEYHSFMEMIREARTIRDS